MRQGVEDNEARFLGAALCGVQRADRAAEVSSDQLAIEDPAVEATDELFSDVSNVVLYVPKARVTAVAIASEDDDGADAVNLLFAHGILWDGVPVPLLQELYVDGHLRLVWLT